MKIYFGTDHAGYELKEALIAFVSDLGHEVADMGAHELDPEDDYPDFVTPVAQAVSEGTADRGIILGGSGQGEDMVADKFPNVRSAVYYGGNLEIVKLSRQHNDANILSLGARFLSIDEAKEAVRIWLETDFSSAPRHERRLKKMDTATTSKDSVDGLVEALGWLGVAMIVLAYAGLQFEFFAPHDLNYEWLNLLGAILIIIDAFRDKNYQPVVLNIIWAGIAVYGIAQIIMF